jgi:hypothetical protein
MRKNQIVFIGILVLLVGCTVGLAFYFSRPKEPSYQGRTLSQWLKKYDFNSRIREGILTESKMREPEQAVRAIGTNGIPTLLRMLTAKDPPGMWELETFLIKIGFGARLCHAAEKVPDACNGFIILGREAQPAVPALVHIVATQPRDGTDLGRTATYHCLFSIEPDKKILLPLLTEQINQTDQIAAYRAAWIIAQLYQPEDARQAGVFKKFHQFDYWGGITSTNALNSSNPPPSQPKGP